MRTTEQDALTRWCPFSRVYAFSVPTVVAGREVVGPAATGGPANRYVNATTTELNPDACHCLASQCMAWIWVGAEHEGAARRGCCGMAHSGISARE